jgi:riboflavin biosynthesis pyrimidine reductase
MHAHSQSNESEPRRAVAPRPEGDRVEPLRVNRLVTIDDFSGRWPVWTLGNDWTRAYFDGPFHLFAPPADAPAISLVFVQSRDGNTGAENPSELGGGPTDKHLIYEGLSRVAADAVLSGASTVGHSVIFTVKHPQMVALRRDLRLPRHPAQIVMSEKGRIDFSSRLFSTPEVPVFVLAGDDCVRRCSTDVQQRPWITIVPIDGDLRGAITRLRTEHGINRISAIGGRAAATALVDAGVVQDLYLTTTALDGGEPNTPWYVGDRMPALQVIVRKIEDTVENPILFEHLAIGTARLNLSNGSA